MGNRFVSFEINNKTKDVTLLKPRRYCFSGHCLTPPSPEILPGSTGSCKFRNARRSFRGSVGVLVYEATNFTLAILFSNPFDYNLYSVEMAVEISLKKAHRGKLEELYRRMYEGEATSSDGDTVFQRRKLSFCEDPISVSAGNIKVTATMSNARESTIKVVVADQDGPSC